MPTTTNFGWTTPADTDLVKDGAAAIRTVAGNIDTSLVDLKGGTTGQYLQKNSNTDLDYVWTTVSTGGMTLISETVASALSSLSFTSLGSYKQLLLMYSGIRHSDNNSYFTLRLNNSSSSIYYTGGLQFKNTTLNVTSATQTSLSGISDGATMFPFGGETNNASISTDVMGSILIDNYTSTTKFKTINMTFRYYGNQYATTMNMNTTAVFGSTSAITSLDVVRLSGTGTFSNTADTSIRLYGLS